MNVSAGLPCGFVMTSVFPVTVYMRREVEGLQEGRLDGRHRVLARDLFDCCTVSKRIWSPWMFATALNVLQPAWPDAALPSNRMFGVTAEGTCCWCRPPTCSGQQPDAVERLPPAAALAAGERVVADAATGGHEQADDQAEGQHRHAPEALGSLRHHPSCPWRHADRVRRRRNDATSEGARHPDDALPRESCPDPEPTSTRC